MSEQNALNSANSAEQSYQNAKACQEQACLCATQAELSRQAASKSESNASSSEKAAKTAQERAEQAAQQAENIAGGDFLERPVYDTQGKKRDIFNYVDDAVEGLASEEYVTKAIGNIQVDVTADIPLHMSINSAGGLRITYDNGV